MGTEPLVISHDDAPGVILISEEAYVRLGGDLSKVLTQEEFDVAERERMNEVREMLGSHALKQPEKNADGN